MTSLTNLLSLYSSEIPRNVLDEYRNKQNFYLYGQLKMSVDDIITQEKIDIAKNINQQQIKKYGPPCNNLEQMSVQRQDYLFSQIIHFLNLYNKENK